MKRYLSALRVPLIITIMNAVLYPYLLGQTPPELAVILMNTVRIVAVLAAGWLVIMHNLGGLLIAGLAGLCLMLIDYPVISGARALFAKQPKVFADILISFAISFWLPMIIAIAGALAARLKLKKKARQNNAA